MLSYLSNGIVAKQAATIPNLRDKGSRLVVIYVILASIAACLSVYTVVDTLFNCD